MLTRFRSLMIAAPALGLVVAACNSGPVDFSGNYSVTVTDGTNQCQFANWTEGQANTNITATITQDPTNMSVAQVTVTGLTALGLDVLLGTHVFSNAQVRGDTLDATVLGTTKLTVQNTACGYTVNAHLQLTLTGNTINGTIEYTPQTNGDPSCGVLNSCMSPQTISGARPAK